MNLSEQQIKEIIQETILQLNSGGLMNDAKPSSWLCSTMDEAVGAALQAQKQLAAQSIDKRKKIISEMRRASLDNAQMLAQMAHDETGYGKVEHKYLKNVLAAEKTPGVEDIISTSWTGDFGLTLVEQSPYGVIGSITPSTNPSSTIINNSISMIAAGNAVVFNPHPAAKKVSAKTMQILNEAIEQAGGPKNLICSVLNPDIKTGRALMEHKDIPILSVTGGEAVVNAAMKTGKKVIAAGPGNPPVIVDETADIVKAGKDIVNGSSFDNNLLCIAEKEVFVVYDIADRLISEMAGNECVKITGGDIQKVLDTVLIKKDNGYVINREFVGKQAGYILSRSGIAFSGTPKLVLAEVEMGHPFVMTEMLMPVLAIVRVRDVNQAIEYAITAEQGCSHSAMMHSQNVTNLSNAARALNTTIFVKNAPSYAGLGFEGEGFTTLTIATPTGEGLTSARSFTRQRRCVLYDAFKIT